MKKWGETCRELSLGRFISQLVIRFQAALYIAEFPREWLPNMPYEQISTYHPIFSLVSSHTWYLMQNLS